MQLEEDKLGDDVIVQDFFQCDKDGVFRTESYYCTKIGQVKGILALHEHYMKFLPIECPENEYLVSLDPKKPYTQGY